MEHTKKTSPNQTINPNLVDHLNHPLAQTIRSLLLKEERRSLKQIIIDDEENIIQAIESQVKLKQIFTTDREKLSKAFCDLIPKDVAIIDVAKRTAKKLFGSEKLSRNFAIADMPTALTVKDLQTIEKDFIVLDNLSISGNVGAIIRTSTALGIGAIILLDSEPVDIYDRRLIRASRGYVFKVPVLSLSTDQLMQFCRENNIKMLVTTLHTDTSIDEVTQRENQLAIIFGSEKEGCSKTLFDAADIKAKIPIYEGVESLNVSAAASIILYLRNLRERNYKLEKL